MSVIKISNDQLPFYDDTIEKTILNRNHCVIKPILAILD
jgi:hypothetical protein